MLGREVSGLRYLLTTLQVCAFRSKVVNSRFILEFQSQLNRKVLIDKYFLTAKPKEDLKPEKRNTGYSSLKDSVWMNTTETKIK